MKVVLALVAGAALGAVATRLVRRSAATPAAVAASRPTAGPGRVAVDVSAFTD